MPNYLGQPDRKRKKGTGSIFSGKVQHQATDVPPERLVEDEIGGWSATTPARKQDGVLSKAAYPPTGQLKKIQGGAW